MIVTSIKQALQPSHQWSASWRFICFSRSLPRHGVRRGKKVTAVGSWWLCLVAYEAQPSGSMICIYKHRKDKMAQLPSIASYGRPSGIVWGRPKFTQEPLGGFKMSILDYKEEILWRAKSCIIEIHCICVLYSVGGGRMYSAALRFWSSQPIAYVPWTKARRGGQNSTNRLAR